MTARDPDALYDDEVVCEIQIKVRRNGSMSVGGAINNKAYALAMLDAAKDSVIQHHNRIASGSRVIIPLADSPFQKVG